MWSFLRQVKCFAWYDIVKYSSKSDIMQFIIIKHGDGPSLKKNMNGSHDITISVIII